MLDPQSVVCGSAASTSLGPLGERQNPGPSHFYWLGICSLTRSLGILMHMKVWEALGYRTMLKSFTDEKQSSFYIFRTNQMEERSKPFICGEERQWERQENAWLRRNKQHCFLPTLPPPSDQPPITTHAHQQLSAWIHSDIERWSS